jgi:DNA integrity scanning protein DisA with diadenylate cyclase activity
VKTTIIKILLSAALIACCAAAVAQVKTPTTPTLSPADKQTAEAFEKRVKDYASLRESLEEKMPKLSKEAKPEEIETHKKQFQERVRAARAGAKHGEIFTPEAQALIRRIIKDEFKGRERAEFRDTVLKEAEIKAVPLRVNYPYPEGGELLEMPATLLLRLPQLPKQVRYRFVGRNFLLVDRENGLIVDYMTNALP